MKKFLILAALVILACGCSHKSNPGKTIPASNPGSAPVIVDQPNGSNTPANTTATNPITTTASASGKLPEKGGGDARTGAGNDAASIAGQSTYNQKCGACHGLKIVSDYTVDRWISVMQVMAMKAHLSDTEKENVLAFVKANAKH
jgi:mono/diheme cytochrome c family protein